MSRFKIDGQGAICLKKKCIEQAENRKVLLKHGKNLIFYSESREGTEFWGCNVYGKPWVLAHFGVAVSGGQVYILVALDLLQQISGNWSDQGSSSPTKS